MKLISWNCQGAFRKKAALLSIHQPDVVIVQECEHPDKLKFHEGTAIPTAIKWFGQNQHKGLGVFTYGDYKLKVLRQHEPELKTIVPIEISNGRVTVTLLAIWANNPTDKKNQYVGQIWKALHHYDKLLHKKNVILAGDFNSNTIWDKKYRIGNHSHVVESLEGKNIRSIYHLHKNELHGKEMTPTFYLYKNLEKPYHLDYCFASKELYEKCSAFQVGSYAEWIAHSDHSPVFVEFVL